MSVHIHSLHIYPIKSCQGINLDQAELTATGFRYDRHWMLVDSQGQFLTQRQYPQLARISTWLNDEALIVGSDNQQQLELPLVAADGPRRQVQIWNDQCNAAVVSPAASRWFSDYLGLECELVFLPESEQRRVDPDYARSRQIVGFADGFPLLVLSRASIDLLNSKLEQAVDINRFRANIVIEGCPAHAEDDWTNISVGGIDIELAKPCSRCAIPSFDQSSAERHPTILKT
ncbi:MAG: MOSC N-terminal beta barrel domain-containing protein, partial [Gammaproteobacteria bacterium]|nr:MOSC N-terminal beta barrel domain-containing protein [Gammaproteobacteria bacterium]